MTQTPDPHQGPDDDAAGPAQGPPAHEPPPVASVAEEAALLIELLSRRGSSRPSGMPSPGSGTDDGPGTREGGRQAGECTCGGSTPASCQVCPLCQLIAFVQQVNPDTIDRVADFVGFAATALRDLAAVQRERRPQPSSDEPTDSAGSPSPSTTDSSPDGTTDGATDGTAPSGDVE